MMGNTRVGLISFFTRLWLNMGGGMSRAELQRLSDAMAGAQVHMAYRAAGAPTVYPVIASEDEVHSGFWYLPASADTIDGEEPIFQPESFLLVSSRRADGWQAMFPDGSVKIMALKDLIGKYKLARLSDGLVPPEKGDDEWVRMRSYDNLSLFWTGSWELVQQHGAAAAAAVSAAATAAGNDPRRPDLHGIRGD